MPHVHPSRRSRLVATSAAGLLAVAGAVVTASPAAAAGTCDTVEKLTNCVTLAGVQEHLAAFQTIADTHGGNRASGMPGHTASADYVQERLEAAGYVVTRQPFDFDYYEVIGTPTFAQTAPTPTEYVYGEDFEDMSYSGSGAVTGTV